MASKGTIGGRIVLEGEAEYRAALKNINQEQKELRSEMKLCTSEFEGNQNSIEALGKKYSVLSSQVENQTRKVELYSEQLEKAEKAQDKAADKVTELKKELEDAEKVLAEMSESSDTSADALENQGKAVEELRKKLSNAEQSYDSAGRKVSEYQTNTNNAQATLNKMQRELDETKSYMDEAAKSTDGCATSIDKFGKKTKESGEEAKKMGENSEEAVNALASVLAASGIAAGFDKIKDAIMECSESAKEFEYSTAKLSTIADTSNVSFGKLREEILKTATEMGTAASDIAEVSYNAISAGVDTAKSVSIAADASMLATAGFTNSSAALSVLTTAMNSYNLTADESRNISDSLIQTQNLGVLTIDQLSSSVGKAISTASAFNVDLYNLESGYISLTKSGIAAAEATTYMSSMFAELGDSGSVVAKTLKEKTGKSFGELMKSGYSLGDVLQILYKSVNGNAEALMNLWGSQEAGKASNAIVNQGLETFNKNLNSVKNSAGATESAFEKMADTTQIAENKMDTSIENLKIAIGERLNPAMVELYETGADITNWAAEFVEENPEVVYAITGLTVGFGALTVGIGAMTVASTVGTKAIEAMNLAIASNPIGLAVTAVVALTAALGTMALAQKAATESYMDDVKAHKESLETINAEINARKTSSADTQAQIVAIDSLTSSLMALNEKEHLNADEKTKLKNIVDQLNTAMPELNLSVDEQTGLLNMNNSELEKLIENQKTYLLVQAAQEDLNEIASEQYEILKEQAEVSEGLAEAQEHLAELESKRIEVIEEGGTALDNYNTQLVMAQDEVNAYNEIIEEQNAKLAELDEEYSSVTDIIGGYTSAVGDAKNAQDDMSTSTYYYGTQVYEVSDSVRQSIDTLTASYEEAKVKAEESLQSQVGLFDELSTKSDLSVQQMAANLQSQTDAYNQYSTDLIAASQIMKDDTTGNFSVMVQSIMDMGMSGAGYLHELVTAAEDSTESFDEVMTSFAEMENARTTLASTMADINTGYSDGIEELITTTETGMTSMADAVTKGMPQVTLATTNLANTIPQTANTVLGVSDGSSSVMNSTGRAVSQGIADGITSNQGAIQTAMQNAINNATANANFSGVTARINQIMGDMLQ